MGKAKAVDSDYSGRPLGEISPEEVRNEDPVDVPYDVLQKRLPDGRIAAAGADGKWYLPGPDGQADLSKPVELQ